MADEDVYASPLPGFQPSLLVPQVLEALKRLNVAKDAYDRATASVDTQYLRQCSGMGDDALAQANAVRKLYGLPERDAF